MGIDTGTTARERLLAELREHALVIGEVVLTSGRTAQYLVDAKRAILRPRGFRALAELVAEQARTWEATAVGGMTMGADPIACAALAGGAEVKAFFVRKEVKSHGLSRRIEGPLLGDQLGQRAEAGGPEDRPLGVDEVLRGLTAGQDDLADHQSVRAQFVDQTLARARLCVEIHRRRSC